MTLHTAVLIFFACSFIAMILANGANWLHRRVCLREMTAEDRRREMQKRINEMALRRSQNVVRW